jgi:acetoin utilization transport system permease protein
MTLKDQFRFVRQNLKKNKTRLFMTVLAAAMGCAFLIVLASVGFGLQKSIIDEITAERLLTEISVYGKEVDGEYRELTEVDLVYLESIDNVQTVTRRQEVQQPLKLTSDDRSAYVNSMVVHYPSEIESGLELFAGRMPGQDDEVIVGYHVYDLLQEDDLPDDGHDPQIGSDVGDASEATENEITDEERNSLLGKTVSLEVIKIDNDGEEEAHELTAKIVGMTAEPSREWLEDHNVLLSESLLEEIETFTGTPLGSMYVEDDIQEHDQGAGTSGENDTANEESDPERTYHEIQVYATSLEDVQQVAEDVRAAGYANHSVADEIDSINTVFYVLKAGLVFVGTIAIIIASIGIFNKMTEDIGRYPRSVNVGHMRP